jgi:hypothetical protein
MIAYDAGWLVIASDYEELANTVEAIDKSRERLAS